MAPRIIALLSSSEIQNTLRKQGCSPVPGSTEEVKRWSTGVLETAIERGCLPVIITTRHQIEAPTDQWWKELVQKAGGKVYCPRIPGDGLCSPQLREPYERFLVEFDLEGPTMAGITAENQHWIAMREAILALHFDRIQPSDSFWPSVMED